MMLLSELAFISKLGRPLLQKKYRYDSKHKAAELFEAKLNEAATPLEPVIDVDGGWKLYHVKRQGIFLVALSSDSVPSIHILEFLTRLFHICRDFCGVLNEDSIRSNLVLLHEVLDEILDYGFVQLASTEKLKPYVHSIPIAHKTQEVTAPGLFGLEQRRVRGDPNSRSVIQSKSQQELRKDEVYVDVIEKISVLIASNGRPERSSVQGEVSMKSFLPASSSSTVRLALNEDLVIGQPLGGYGAMSRVDRCTFHSVVDTSDMAAKKLLSFSPLEGQFSVMSYELTEEMPVGLPFRLFSYSRQANRDIEVGLKLRCETPASCHAVNISAALPLPHTTTGVVQSLSSPDQSAQFSAEQSLLTWSIPKLNGQAEAAAHFKVLSGFSGPSFKQEVGPLRLDFELSGFVCSNLKIRSLRVVDSLDRVHEPHAWIRYISTADTYVCKLA